MLHWVKTSIYYGLCAVVMSSCNVKMNRDSFLSQSKGAVVLFQTIPQVLKGGSTITLNLQTAGGDAAIQSQLIEFSSDGVSFSPVANFKTLTSSYAWKIPTLNTRASVLRYTATDSNNIVTTTLSAPFAIDSLAPTLTVSAPVNGAAFTAGAVATINYASTDLHFGSTPISLDYSTNSGSTWTNIATNVSNVGTYAWTTPYITSATVKVRVTSTDGVGNTFSVASALFSISNAGVPTVTIGSPTMASIIYSGTTMATYTVSGTCSENGRTVTVAVTDGTTTVQPTTQPTCGAGLTYTTTVNVSTLTDATLTFKADHTNAGGTAAVEATVSVVKDTTAPTATSIAINAGAVNTTSTSVTLTLAATGAADMYITNTAGCGSGGAYETYATSKAWTLGAASGSTSVYVKFRDAAQNVSACTSASIYVTTAFAQIWNVNSSTIADYTYGAGLSFTATSCSLTMMDQTDDDNTATGFAGTTSSVGVAWNATNKILKLNATTNNAELDRSWTPQWASITGYWKLNGAVGAVADGTTVPAAVGASGVATLSNGSGISYAAGQLGQGMTFDATWEAVVFPVASTRQHDLTVAGWVKVGNGNSGGGHMTALRNGTGANGYYFGIGNDRYPEFDVAGIAHATATATVTNNSWYYVAATFSSANIVNFYINGDYVSSTDLGGATPNVPTTSTTLGQLYSGEMDDFAIWDKALTSTEIRTIYDRQSATYSGTLTSRVMDAVDPASTWTFLSWLPTLPFLKELPDYASGAVQNESATDYSSLPTGIETDAGLTNGLVGLWHLDELSPSGASSVIDSSGAGNSGTPAGTLSYAQSGKFNHAFQFDGSSGSVDVGNAASLQITGQITLAAWVSPASFPTLGNNSTILEKAFDGTKEAYMLRIDNRGGVMTLVSGSYDSPSDTCYIATADISSWVTNSWHHVVGNYDGSNWNLYIDGVLANTTSATSGAFASSAGVHIGASNILGSTARYFNGLIDEVGIWNRSLSAAEVLKLYNFSSGSNLMSGIVGLWHLNEAAGTTGAGSIKDSSGQGNHGTPNGGVVFENKGRFGNAPVFNGSNGYISIPESASLKPSYITIAFWIRLDASPGCGPSIIALSDGPYNQVELCGTGLGVETDGTLAGSQRVGGPSLNLGQTYHVAFTYDGSFQKLYIDGALYNSLAYAGGPLEYNASGYNPAMMSRPGYGAYAAGMLDEVGIWNRPLTGNEILTLYRRGANRVKHQVRICTASDCSDDTLDAHWKGPDGSNQTYFSELDNMSSQSATPSGTVNAILPFMDFSHFTSPVGTSRYFQYRTILESDDTSTNCTYDNGTTFTWCSPELKSVTIGPNRYPTVAPSVVGTNGVADRTLSTFTQTLGAGGCSSGVTYNLGIGASAAAATWYWWDSTANSGAGDWVAAGGTTSTSNASSVVNTHAAAFATKYGAATIYFKAFLNSTGSSSCTLNSLELDGRN